MKIHSIAIIFLIFLSSSFAFHASNANNELLERDSLEFEKPPIDDLPAEHPAVSQLPLEYTPQFVEKSEKIEKKPTPVSASKLENGATVVTSVLSVKDAAKGKEGGKEGAQPPKDAQHSLETTTTTTMRRIIKQKKEESSGKKKCGSKDKKSSDANLDTTTIRITVTQEDEDCEQEDPLLASKRQQIENLDIELKKKRDVYSNEMKWLRSAEGLLKELLFKVKNVKSHIELVTKEIAIIGARREQAQRELIDLERKKAAEQTLRVLEAELAQLIASAQTANDKMEQLKEKKSIYVQKIDEVRKVLENVRANVVGGATQTPSTPKSNEVKPALLI